MSGEQDMKTCTLRVGAGVRYCIMHGHVADMCTVETYCGDRLHTSQLTYWLILILIFLSFIFFQFFLTRLVLQMLCPTLLRANLQTLQATLFCWFKCVTLLPVGEKRVLNEIQSFLGLRV